MWFLPLKSNSNPHQLGLRVGVPNFRTEIKREASNAVLVILDCAIGERSAALDVQYVETAALPANPEKEGYIELHELGQYIDWWKGKK